MAMMVVNWPLFAFLRNRSCHFAILVVQFIVTTAVITVLVIVSGEQIERPSLVVFLLSLCESLFLAIAPMTLPELRPSCIPLRFVHYVLGAVMTAQFGCIPICESIDSISVPFALYIFNGFNKSFQLGYILTLARIPGFDPAFPLAARPGFLRDWDLSQARLVWASVAGLKDQWNQLLD